MRELVSRLVDNKVKDLWDEVERNTAINAKSHDRLKVLAIGAEYDYLFGPENQFEDRDFVMSYFLTDEKSVLAFNRRIQNDVEEKLKEGNPSGTINKYINALVSDISIMICKERLVKMAVEFSVS